MPKKIYIRTFGCQMNDRDSELVYGLLSGQGYAKTDTIEEADIAVFNTCSVRKHAEERAYGRVGMLKKWKQENPKRIIGIIGCMAQSHKGRIFERLPHVDFICGPANIYDIPKLILRRRVQDQQRYISALDQKQRPNIEQPALRQGPTSAYVSIGEGCDNFCSYCIVPYVRGRERSRSKKLILQEVARLTEAGIKEVILLGQNVNSYRSQGQRSKSKERGFVKLLENINKVRGIERIRFMTSHPKDANKDLFKAMRDLRKVCEHLHLPLQSGSNRILERMRRGYSREGYLRLVGDYRKILPRSSLTTDIIVGFPGESSKDFHQTCRTMKEIGFDSAFIFKYSPRPPAKSCARKDDVPVNIKEDRNHRLLDLQREMSRKVNERLIGREAEVFVESENRKPKGKSLRGRTRTNKITVFDGSQRLINTMVDVKIRRVTPNTLIGEWSGHEHQEK